MTGGGQSGTIRRIAYTLLALWSVVIVSGISYRNIFLVPAAVALYVLFGKERTTAAAGRTPYMLSTVLAVFTLLARYREMTAPYESMLFRILTLLIAGCGFFLITLYLFRSLADKAFRIEVEKRLDASRDHLPGLFGKGFDAHPLLVSFCACLLARIPWFLYSYPGILNPDSVSQLEQAAGIDALVNAHPVYHTLLLRLFLRMAQNATAGVALYHIAQMIYMAFCCALAVSFLHRMGVRRVVCVLGLLFYALTPFMNVYSIIVWKDGPFAATLIPLSVSLYEIACAYGKSEAISYGMLLRFSVSCLVAALLRSNAGLVMIIPLVLTGIVFRKQARRILPVLSALVLLLLFLLSVLPGLLRIGKSDMIEKLNLPVQQIARVITEGQPVSEDDMALVTRVTGDRDMSLWYDPYYADSMKAMVRTGDQRALEEHAGQYLLLYLRWACRYPMSYIRAFGDLTGAMLYPDISYGIAEVEGIYENRLGLTWQPLLRGAFFVKLRELVTRLPYYLPGVSLLFSCGTYSWLLLITTALLFMRKEKRSALALVVPSAAVFVTLLFSTPIASEFRYVYGIAMCAPLWVLMPFYAPSVTTPAAVCD